MDGEKKSATDIVLWIMKKTRATDIDNYNVDG
jgi:hypothetical protein